MTTFMAPLAQTEPTRVPPPVVIADVPPREFLDLTSDAPDEGGVQLLREILTTSRKIVVVAGAGISVAAGIPDFRGAKGIFSQMKAKGRSGQMMFDTSVYRSADTIEDFHEMIGNLYEASKRTAPTPFHNLLESLAKSNRLLRLYTQNIDFLDTRHPNLNTVVPVPAVGPWPKVIAVHGSLEKMTCTKCQIVKDFNPELFRIWKEDTPECIDCKRDEDARAAAGRRRLGVGFIRPRMVLYGEPGYDALNIGSCMASDLRNRPDALIVVGTTLKIPGTKTMVKEMSKAVGNRGHIIWLNMDDAPGGEFDDVWDFVIKGDCQRVARLMEGIPITHKDQSFVLEEAISASQTTQADVSDNPGAQFWKVVSDQTRLGLLTPAPSIPSTSDDEKIISGISMNQAIQAKMMKSSTKKSTKVIPQTDATAFYAPLATKKTNNSLKRKRGDDIVESKLVSGKKSPAIVPKPKTEKSTQTSKKTQSTSKKSKASRPSLIIKLKLSPTKDRTLHDVYNDETQSEVALAMTATALSTRLDPTPDHVASITPIEETATDSVLVGFPGTTETGPSLSREPTLEDDPPRTDTSVPPIGETQVSDSGGKLNRWASLGRRKSTRISSRCSVT